VIWLLVYYLIGLLFVGFDVVREWDRAEHGLLIPVAVLIFVPVGWPIYLAWKACK
jgi:hypothetical protein